MPSESFAPPGLDQFSDAATTGVMPADQVAQKRRQARAGAMSGDRLGIKTAAVATK